MWWIDFGEQMLRNYRTRRRLLTKGNGQTKARYNIIHAKEQGYPPEGILK